MNESVATQLTFLIFLIFAVGIANVLLKAFTSSSRLKKSQHIDDDDYFPYAKCPSVMTKAEQRYFRTLEQQHGQQYYVFPQVKLDKIIQVTDQENFYKYWGKIKYKSMDFILVDKQTLETVSVIELDDPSHLLPDRVERDTFLEKVFRICAVKIERVKS